MSRYQLTRAVVPDGAGFGNLYELHPAPSSDPSPMTQSRPSAFLALVALLALSGQSALGENSFELDPERVGTKNIVGGEAWKEGALTLPAWPRDADLVEWVPEGTGTGLRYFIDGANLRLDPSGEVVRYTLVVQGNSGIRNVSYEGIHCTLRGEYKVYAYGIEGRFDRAPPSDWARIVEIGSEAFRDDLHRHRFCVPRETQARPVKDMIRALRGRVSATESTGFQAD